MIRVIRRWTTAMAMAMFAMACLLAGTGAAQAQSPSWLSSAVIYCVNPEIFSTSGLAGVTAQLPRLSALGVNTIWLMPIYPRGNVVTVDGVAHTADYDSPYDISNLEGVDPSMGTSAQLTTLVTDAHNLGMKVIMDLDINCTSWDNPLIESNTDYYYNSGSVTDEATIEPGWYMTSSPENDIAMLDLEINTYGAQTYVTDVADYWVQNYGIDGFRVDSADNPTGSTRSLPASLSSSIYSSIKGINSNVMMLGEEENVSLALSPYDLDYGWNMWYYGVETAFTTSGDASTLEYQWEYPYTSSNTSPSGMLHMNIQDDWDLANRDVVTLGGAPQAMAAAVFNCTTSGVPLIYNGMEVANTNGGNNSHTQINWSGSNAYAFSTFYQQLLALRNNSGGALQQGTTTWVTNSSSAVTSYDRTGGGQEYLVEINTNGSTASGTISPPSGGAWIEVTPAGAPGGQSHENPGTGDLSLLAYDFAIFERSSAGQPAATPTFSLAPGAYVGTQTLTMSDTTSGATIYYTTNGTTPTTSSTKYTGGFGVSSSETVEAMAVGAAQGSTRTAAYTIVAGSGGAISGSETAVTTATTYNLTSEGTSDWAAWGYLGSDTFDQDTSGNNLISDAGLYNGGGAGQFSNSIIGLTWTNGSEDGSVTNAGTGIYNGGGVGDGFVFTVPASTTSSTLTVYVGGWESGGTLTASLSDDSAAAYSNSSLSNSSSNYYGVYTLNFKAASAGQTLTVTWVQASGSGNVTLQAAALVANGLPTAATPTFSPAAGTYTTSQSVTLSDSTSGSTIYYTTNGTTPTTSSTKYTGAISVTSSETIEAIAAASGYNNSNVGSATYTISLPTVATPTFSPAAGSYGSSQSVTISDSTSGSTIYYTTNGATPTTSSTKYTGAISVTSSETVEAIAAASGDNNSNIGSAAYVIETLPAAPTSPSATGGNAQVSLSWTASTGATSYNVYRSTTSGGEGTTAIASGITTTTYTNTGLTNGAKYYYKIAAVNLAGTSAQSTEVSATPAAPVEGPYGGTPAAIPGTVYADAYDTGGANLGYYVTSVNGTDNTWRTTGDGVDLEACTDSTTNGADLGWTAATQWFRYTVNVATAGNYVVSFRVADGSSSTATLQLNNSAGTDLSGVVTVPTTGGWQTWTTVTATVTLPAGQQVLTVLQDSANSNINYMSFAAAGVEGPYGGTAAAIPGTVYADAYDTGGANVGYYVSSVNGTDNGWRTTGDGVDLEACTDTTTNGADVGWTASGQWMRYTVNVASAGSYVVSFRVADGSTAGSLQLNNSSGTDLSGVVTVPATGGWQTWTTVNANVTLPAGQQVLTIYQDSANVNINYLTFAKAGSGTLSGAVTSVTSAQAFNLTSIGATDWAAWGFDGTDRDTSGGSKIGTLYTYSGGSLNQFTSGFLGLTWTNGTPDASETDETDGYYNNAGVGDGFSFQVPASTTTQHITVYVGGWETGGTLSSYLSDGSASSYSNTTLSNSSNSYYGYYTLTYAAASAGQYLTVNWVQASGSGNVTIYGAALH